jgi:hypothetical protein
MGGRLHLHGKPAIGRVHHAFAQQGRSEMATLNGSADSKKRSIPATVLDKYCRQAGVEVGDPARDRLGCQIIKLFQSGVDQPDELFLALNHGYDEWLGEVGLPSSSDQAASLASGAAPPIGTADHPSISPQRFPQRKTPPKRGF